MSGRTIRVFSSCLALLLLFAPCALAQYDYGGGRSSGSSASSDGGFVLFLEGGLFNPRNADNVVASVDSGGVYRQVIPTWDDTFAGRIGLGYRLPGGHKIMLAVWGFTGEAKGAESGPSFEFPIGPTTGNAFDITTEIEAGTADLYWEIPQHVTDRFSMDWALGVRYARFEETADGTYVDGASSYDAAKSNKGTMIGGRAAGRARYKVGQFSAAVGVGMSFLDGELESKSSLDPKPSEAVDFELTDTGRSGTIFDFDVTGAWHSANDLVMVTIGWEQAVWEDIASDLTRNLPGTENLLRDRDSVTFSGYKIGVHFQF